MMMMEEQSHLDTAAIGPDYLLDQFQNFAMNHLHMKYLRPRFGNNTSLRKIRPARIKSNTNGVDRDVDQQTEKHSDKENSFHNDSKQVNLSNLATFFI